MLNVFGFTSKNCLIETNMSRPSFRPGICAFPGYKGTNRSAIRILVLTNMRYRFIDNNLKQQMQCENGVQYRLFEVALPIWQTTVPCVKGFICFIL